MGHKRAMCTIIAKNYLASARSLCKSFRAVHPDYQCYVLIVDEFSGYINPSEEPFEIITLKELEFENLPSLCFKYDVTELCTAVKARLLQYLMDTNSVNQLLYLDPDILVTASLDRLYEHLDSRDIVLTPHIDTDYPEDGFVPNDGTILYNGLYNLGFIGVNSSEQARSFLEWWKAKLYSKCVKETPYFVDQKFVDLVPLLFRNTFIERGVGYNVAYWNLHSRRISHDKEGWQCNDQPLHFFHFSNYHPEQPEVIASPLTRYRMAERPDLQPLFSEYNRHLEDNGHAQVRRWPYSFGFFETGEAIPYELRCLYRHSPEKWDEYGDPFRSEVLKAKLMEIDRQTLMNKIAGKVTHAFQVLAWKSFNLRRLSRGSHPR